MIVSESGLYVLIFRSRKPAAKRIRKWVTQEVLPTIRKTGRYEYPANDADEGSKGVGSSDILGLETRFDIERMNVRVAMLREYRHIFGKDTAQRMVGPLGLPVPDLPDALPVLAAPGRVSLEHCDPTVRGWIEDRCELEPGVRTRAKALFRDYEGWCEVQDQESCGPGTFGRQLERAGLRGFHSNGTWRKGIRLKD